MEGDGKKNVSSTLIGKVWSLNRIKTFPTAFRNNWKTLRVITTLERTKDILENLKNARFFTEL